MEEISLKSLKNSRRIVWAFFLFGAIATVMVNFAYASPDWGPRLLSIVAPVSVLGTVEILGRVPFRKTWVWKMNQYILVFIVGGSALFVSYYHTAHLAIRYGFEPIVAWIQPMVTDGMMIISALALISIKEHMEAKYAEIRHEKEKAEELIRVEAELEKSKMEISSETEVKLGEVTAELETKDQEIRTKVEEIDSLKEELERAQEQQVQVVHESDLIDTEEMDPEIRRAWDRNSARTFYLNSVNSNNPITAEELAEKYDQDVAWAESRITEVNYDMKQTPQVAIAV